MIFHVLIFCGDLAITDGAQSLLPVLCTGITSGGMSGIKYKSVACKASARPTVLSSLVLPPCFGLGGCWPPSLFYLILVLLSPTNVSFSALVHAAPSLWASLYPRGHSWVTPLLSSLLSHWPVVSFPSVPGWSRSLFV